MKFLIAYATTEGQTRKIARFCADRLADQGHAVELLQVAPGVDLTPGRFDGVILAASVHIGKYQSEMAEAVRAHAGALNRVRTLLIAVSLAAAGEDAEDLAELDRIAALFQQETGWRAGQVAQVAGAFRFTQYDFFRFWAMRWIASQKGQKVDPKADREYTDWAALAQVLDGWVAGRDRPAG